MGNSALRAVCSVLLAASAVVGFTSPSRLRTRTPFAPAPGGRCPRCADKPRRTSPAMLPTTLLGLPQARETAARRAVAEPLALFTTRGRL